MFAEKEFKTQRKTNEHCRKSQFCSGPFPRICRHFLWLLCAMLCLCHSTARPSLPLFFDHVNEVNDVANVWIFDACKFAELSCVSNRCHPLTDLTSWGDTGEGMTECNAWLNQAQMKDKVSSEWKHPKVNDVVLGTSWEQSFVNFFRWCSPFCLMWLSHSSTWIDKDWKKVSSYGCSSKTRASVQRQIFGVCRRKAGRRYRVKVRKYRLRGKIKRWRLVQQLRQARWMPQKMQRTPAKSDQP